MPAGVNETFRSVSHRRFNQQFNIEQHQGDLKLGNEDTDQVRIHGVVCSTHSSGTLQFNSPSPY